MISFLRQNKAKIWQFLRLSIISGFIFITSVLLIVSILVYIYRDTILEGFIRQLNRGLKTEIFIDDISINAFRNFPFVSLTLKNITALETQNVASRDTLMTAQRIYLQFSVWDMLRKNYSIRRVEIVRASMDMKVFPDNSNNYTFWQTAEDDASSGDLSFQLQRVIFNQVEYTFTDFLNRHFVGVKLRKAEMQGDFSQIAYVMKLQGEAYIDEIIVDDMLLFREKSLDFNLGLDVNNNNLFYFRQGHLNLAGNQFHVDGLLDLSDEAARIDVGFGGQQLKLENLINILPPAYRHYLVGYKSKGELYFEASIKGFVSSDSRPFITANFGIKSGELLHSKSNLRFRNVNFEGGFDNGSRNNISTSRLSIKGLNAVLNNGTLQADGTIFDFSKPQIDIKLFSDIEAGDWFRFLMIDTLKNAAGKLLIDLNYKGGVGVQGKFTSADFLGSNVSGIIKAENVNFELKDNPLNYHSINADFVFNNNDIVVNNFSGFASGSDFKLKGYFRNVLPWLFLTNEKIFIDAGLQSSNINFNELLQYSVNESDTTYKLRLSDKIDFQFTADIGKLTFKKFEATGVRGKLNMKNQIFFADNIGFASMKGNVKASGFINGATSNKLLIGCEATIVNVDVHDMFYQLGNFGQNSIVADNLQGRATAGMKLRSEWSPTLDIDMNSLEITADIKIENGELINYTPMLALSRFLRVGDLNHVKFSTLENQIRLKDQKIIIPDMEIKSNALNIKISGEHTLQHDIHYRLQVLLSELLARNNRQSRNPQEQYGDIIDDGLGRTTLFLLVTGTIDDPVFRYDRQGVREKLRDDFRRERETLRDVFRTEFRSSANTTPATPDATPAQQTEREKQQKEIKKREEGRFVIEWD